MRIDSYHTFSDIIRDIIFFRSFENIISYHTIFFLRDIDSAKKYKMHF